MFAVCCVDVLMQVPDVKAPRLHAKDRRVLPGSLPPVIIAHTKYAYISNSKQQAQQQQQQYRSVFDTVNLGSPLGLIPNDSGVAVLNISCRLLAEILQEELNDYVKVGCYHNYFSFCFVLFCFVIISIHIL
jgi:hypothetical protein